MFFGGLIDTEVHSDWSLGAVHFSGYKTNFEFTKLVFEPDAHGLYTLRSGDVAAESGDVVESMTNPGTNGTCNATFTFATAGGAIFDAKLTGNIGSLSKTNKGWNATIELGVALPGVITKSDGCGPNNEGTSHQFGEPPKISIPITANGELEPGPKWLMTVDSTTSFSTTGGGHQSDDITGTLSPRESDVDS